MRLTGFDLELHASSKSFDDLSATFRELHQFARNFEENNKYRYGPPRGVAGLTFSKHIIVVLSCRIQGIGSATSTMKLSAPVRTPGLAPHTGKAAKATRVWPPPTMYTVPFTPMHASPGPPWVPPT